MSVTVRKVKWAAAYLRPTEMPSVTCPRVKDWLSGEVGEAVMGIMYCNACAYAREMYINYADQNGEVHCAAG